MTTDLEELSNKLSKKALDIAMIKGQIEALEALVHTCTAMRTKCYEKEAALVLEMNALNAAFSSKLATNIGEQDDNL